MLSDHFSFCCSGEVTVEWENYYDASMHRSYIDLAVDNPANPSAISMLIKKSKTDQAQREAKIYLGKTGDIICPIATMEACLSVRRYSSVPLFQWESIIPLSKSSFVKHVRAVLEEAGLPAKDYGGHSLKIDATTTAAVAGLEDSAIWTLGQW